ncbi:MAG: U32 family peptidase [Acidobacteriota bacterium]|nr:U32 family peptidase [Acidobacteriota bacterium]
MKLVATPPLPPDTGGLENLPGLSEILLEHEALARGGRMSNDELLTLYQKVKDHGKRAVLVWDILADDNAIADGAAVFRRLGPERFDAVRVQDVGIAWYLAEHFPELPLQLVVETGNHNLTGLTAWIDQFRPERLVVSNEIPNAELSRMRRALNVPMEILAYGRLLIFYTPRRLLSPIDPETDEYDFLSRFVTSVEDGKHFPIVENRHGTFMYYEKELFLLPWLHEAEAGGMDYARLDLKYADPKLLPRLIAWFKEPTPANLEAVKALTAPKLTRGFFKSNRTDKQFSRLKNPHLGLRGDRTYLGRVVDVGKKEYVAILTEQPLKVGDTIHYAIPEGEMPSGEVAWIRDPTGKKVEKTDRPGLWLVNHCRKVSTGSRAYL